MKKMLIVEFEFESDDELENRKDIEVALSSIGDVISSTDISRDVVKKGSPWTFWQLINK